MKLTAKATAWGVGLILVGLAVVGPQNPASAAAGDLTIYAPNNAASHNSVTPGAARPVAIGVSNAVGSWHVKSITPGKYATLALRALNPSNGRYTWSGPGSWVEVPSDDALHGATKFSETEFMVVSTVKAADLTPEQVANPADTIGITVEDEAGRTASTTWSFVIRTWLSKDYDYWDDALDNADDPSSGDQWCNSSYGYGSTVESSLHWCYGGPHAASVTAGKPFVIKASAGTVNPRGLNPTADIASVNGIEFSRGGKTTSLSAMPGTLVDNQDGTWTLTPDANVTGWLSFRWKIRGVDPVSGEAPEGSYLPVSISMNIVPQAAPTTPSADDFEVSTTEDTTITIDALAHASGDQLALTALGEPGHGSAAILDEKISYAPSTHFTGNDSFTYTVTDSTGQTATGTIAVSITPAPVIPAPTPTTTSGAVPPPSHTPTAGSGSPQVAEPALAMTGATFPAGIPILALALLVAGIAVQVWCRKRRTH